MEARELRIGNYVQTPLKIIQIIVSVSEGECEIDGSEFGKSYFDVDDLEPVSLTEEWLLKFGFDNKEFECNQHIYFFDSPVRFMRRQLNSSRHQFLANLEYVHDLQNLFYALTGQELEIKELKTQ